VCAIVRVESARKNPVCRHALETGSSWRPLGKGR
jgi:hypothetical protein